MFEIKNKSLQLHPWISLWFFSRIGICCQHGFYQMLSFIKVNLKSSGNDLKIIPLSCDYRLHHKALIKLHQLISAKLLFEKDSLIDRLADYCDGGAYFYRKQIQ